MTFLLVLALYVLYKRKRQVRAILSANTPIILFFLYCGITLLWADFPFVGFKRLRPRGMLVWATTMGRVATSPFPPFPRAAWPPRLAAFRVDHGWEGQPAPDIEQRLRAIAAACWNLDVRVYFATQHPSRDLLAEAQAQLDRLLLPTC